MGCRRDQHGARLDAGGLGRRSGGGGSIGSPSRGTRVNPLGLACPMLVYAVVDDALSPDFPLGVELEMFIRHEDAERFIEEVRGDDPDLTAKLRIEERELEAGGGAWPWASTLRERMSNAIVIVEYDPTWPSEFVRLRDRAQAALAMYGRHRARRFDSRARASGQRRDRHGGLVESDDDVNEAIPPGGDRLPGAREPRRRGPAASSWPESEKRHHLYVRQRRAQSSGASRVPRSSAVRSECRRRYVALKRELAARHGDDRRAYTEGRRSSSRRP